MSSFIEKPRYACAMGGALATVNALPRTVPILHSSMGCGSNLNGAINAAAGQQGSFFCSGLSVPCSGIQENEIVFGGEERLTEQIKETIEIVDGELFVVLTGCMAEMIGDDFNAVVNSYKNQGVNIIAVSTAGFKGNSYTGYDLVLESIFKNYLEKGLAKKKNKINIWGIPPAQDVFWAGNLLEIRRILEELGFEVNSFFTYKDSLAEIKKSGEAELNIVLSPVFGIEAAKFFQENFGTPYISTNVPFGLVETEKFVDLIKDHFNLNEKKVLKYLSNEKEKYYYYFSRFADAYNDLDLQRYSVIIGNSNYVLGLSDFVHKELGWLPELLVVTDVLSDEDRDKIKKLVSEINGEFKDKLVFETDTSRIEEHLAEKWPRYSGSRYYKAFSPAYVLGSVLDRPFAESIGAGFLSVSYPVTNRIVLNKSYAGYSGGLSLAEDIFGALVVNR